ncbi:MAG: ATP-grasp domain-containing protein [Thermodesulfobacteriota bacterium]|nr:ATP-grasp domain-containing protein [Thermodesulfobacteriota bacterium]
MSTDTRVLVVGTSPDYVDWIRRAAPGRALFLTDPVLRQKAKEPAPGPDEEVCGDLEQPGPLLEALSTHTRQRGIAIDGVACFDCESLPVAAVLAQQLGLDFVSPAAVAACRDKSVSKRLWREKGVMCPAFAPVFSKADAVAFFEAHGTCVIKPVSGAGSELVFCCDTKEACGRAFGLVKEGLLRRAHTRLYHTPDNSAAVVAETWLTGPEFSCDFLVEGDRAVIVRLTKKIVAPDIAFGTAMAYVLINRLPGLENHALARHLAAGAGALGIDRALCMADFVLEDGRPAFLEITPRPGGDCLPGLIRHGLGIDTLLLDLDLAQHRPLPAAFDPAPVPMAGLRFHARQAGVLTSIDWSRVAAAPGVREVTGLRRPGHPIVLPPDDYDSFLLGSAIFALKNPAGPAEECQALLNRLIVEIFP